MNDTEALRPGNRPCWRGLYIAALAMLAVFGHPPASLAEADSAQWFEMARACEQVIADQSMSVLSGYEPAPFSTGRPGVKEYAVFGPSRHLVVTARVEDGEWTRCLVREAEKHDRSRWQEIAPLWNAGFAAAFPKPQYLWVKSRLNPYMPFIGAFRCEEGRFVLAVTPYLGSDFDFLIEVTSQTTGANERLCAGGKD